ncbi:MAG: hypothetical protein ACFB4I_20270 [Cyanophyceae cyanobacterium]
MSKHVFVNHSLLKRQKACEKRNRQQSNYASYNCFLILIAAIPVAIVAFLNWTIDPLDIFKTPNYWQLNHEKPRKDNNDRLFKAVDVIRLQPEIIIGGSSRTKQGINPDYLPIGSEKAYNLAIDGPNFYEISRYIEHAIHNQPDLKQIILGLDFFMFNKNLQNQPTFENSRLEKKQMSVEDLVNSLFSIDVLNYSLETIKASRNSPKTIEEEYGDNGFMPNRNFDNGETVWRFEQSIKLYFKLHSNYQFSQSYWNDFKQIVQLCQENDIDLKVFISPAHATQWESIDATGKWSIFEQWKREIVQLTPVWDFSGYHSISTEKITERMKYYADNSHYGEQVGNLIINRIFNHNLESVPADFGILVTSQNIESHLANIRRQKETWRTNNPEEMRLVEQLRKESTAN